MILNEMLDVVQWLKTEGFTLRNDLGGEGFIMTDEELIVGIFPSYVREDQETVVCAETKETFNKFSQIYYTKKIPTSNCQKIQILKDFETIKKREHVERANNFYIFSEQYDDWQKSNDYHNKKFSRKKYLTNKK